MAEKSWAGVSANNLSEDQKNFLRQVIGNKESSHFLTGCAGSGKTVLAAHAAEILKEGSSDFDVSMIVYTKLLSRFIADGFKEFDQNMMEDVSHFHARFKSGNRAKHSNMAIVDEFQDFQSSWIENIKRNSDAQIWLGDATQQIYQDAREDGGVRNLHSEFEDNHIRLNVNYRNSISVAQLAKHFMVIHEFDKVDIKQKVNEFIFPIHRNDHQNSAANNQPNVFIEASDEDEEYDILASIIKDLINSDEPKTHIAVAQLHNKDVDRLNRALTSRGVKTFRVNTRMGYENLPDFNDKKLVMLSTIHSLKGLETDYIFFPRTEEDKIAFWKDKDQDILDNLCYVLFTRAKRRVYCSYIDKHSSYIWNKVFGKKLSPDDGNDGGEVDSMDEFFQYVDASDFVLGASGVPKISEEKVRENVAKSESVEEKIQKHFSLFDDEGIDIE